MSSHVLLQNATRSPYREEPDMPPGAEYDRINGLWVVGGQPLVGPESGFGPLTTKKCDQETGEDRKGE